MPTTVGHILQRIIREKERSSIGDFFEESLGGEYCLSFGTYSCYLTLFRHKILCLEL